MSELNIGDKVTGIYKTGKYIGEITDIRPQSYLVRVLAVLKHPTQGDLHHPKEVDGVFFQERRALAYREQTNVPLKMVKPFTEDIPDYQDSLQEAIEKMRAELLSKNTQWAEKSLMNLKSLEKDYFK
ncbi:kinase-associated lipoprotein B [Cytobacillus sp. FSL W7-1323]|uniref:Kinase n=1 Tax=Cytobacillus kochii TaxID=859143 RepID=A0A248TK45_9BACI|nr:MULTISPECIES: kinase-associated lipoprotein B [Cytobacillus]ASV68499.1 kinase [Cytobacillus kochii]MDQ0187252.1 kinase-associated protein B [Cytobacillus kochii]MEA1855284.1 kinase-associated lipoprotein B [Cytobacillus sp. OWB-43]